MARHTAGQGQIVAVDTGRANTQGCAGNAGADTLGADVEAQGIVEVFG